MKGTSPSGGFGAAVAEMATRSAASRDDGGGDGWKRPVKADDSHGRNSSGREYTITDAVQWDEMD